MTQVQRPPSANHHQLVEATPLPIEDPLESLAISKNDITKNQQEKSSQLVPCRETLQQKNLITKGIKPETILGMAIKRVKNK